MSVCVNCEHRECARVRRDEKRRQARLQTCAPQLLESLRAMIHAANLVIARWSDGDLAAAVNDLESVTIEAREIAVRAGRQ
jgi:hypothetical protein